MKQLGDLPPDPLGVNYDPEVYWPAAGVLYESWFDPAGYRRQEEALELLLHPLPWSTVLDVGCGFGRLGELIGRVRPGASYTGFDISPDQIAAAQRRLSDGMFACCSIRDAATGDAVGTYDLVISAEVLMHQPAKDIEWIVSQLYRWCRPGGHVVHCEWWEEGCAEYGNAWNVMHDYAALHGDRLVSRRQVGRQAIFVGRA